MSRRVRTPAPAPASLAQQQSDFTAEGAPPPGLVAQAVPQTPAKKPAKEPAKAPAQKPPTSRNPPVVVHGPVKSKRASGGRYR